MGVLPLPSGTFAAAVTFLVVALAFRLLARGSPMAQDLGLSVVLLAAACALILARALAPDALQGDGWRSVNVIVVLLIAVGAIRVVESLLLELLRRRRGVEVPRIVRDVGAFVLYGVTLAVVLRATLQIDLASIVATSAVLSVIIGLALQETLGHLFSGLALSIEKPFQVGDWITAGPHTGKVTEMTWRSTKLLTFEDDLVVVPNGLIAKDIVRNFSRPTTTHARILEIGVVYGVAPNDVKDAIRAALRENKNVLAEPEPEVQLVGFGDFAISYRIRFWIAAFSEHRFIEDQVLSALWYKLRREGIAIPFPIRDVNVRMVGEQAAREEEERRVAEAEALLADVYFIPVLPESIRRALARRTRQERFGRGEQVIHQGEQGETFYVVARGEVEVFVHGGDGRDQKVARLGRGEYFGEMSLLTGEPRSATVVAASDVALLVLDRSSFADLLATDPAVPQALSDALGRRRGELESAATAAQPSRPATPLASHRILDRLRDIFKLK